MKCVCVCVYLYMCLSTYHNAFVQATLVNGISSDVTIRIGTLGVLPYRERVLTGIRTVETPLVLFIARFAQAVRGRGNVNAVLAAIGKYIV